MLFFPTRIVVIVAIAGSWIAKPASAHEDLLDAISKLTQQITASPADARLRLRRGELYRLHRDWAKADSDYDVAALLDPSLPEVAVARGEMLLDSGKADQALRLLETVVTLRPVAARRVRARAYLALGRPSEAAADYLEAIRHSTQPEPDFFIDCARAYGAAGDDASALGVLDDACAQSGAPLSLETSALDLELKLQRFAAALKRIDRLAANADRKERWLTRRGEILEQMGRREEALAAYEAALVEWNLVPTARRHTAAAAGLESEIKTALSRLKADPKE